MEPYRGNHPGFRRRGGRFETAQVNGIGPLVSARATTTIEIDRTEYDIIYCVRPLLPLHPQITSAASYEAPSARKNGFDNPHKWPTQEIAGAVRIELRLPDLARSPATSRDRRRGRTRGRAVTTTTALPTAAAVKAQPDPRLKERSAGPDYIRARQARFQERKRPNRPHELQADLWDKRLQSRAQTDNRRDAGPHRQQYVSADTEIIAVHSKAHSGSEPPTRYGRRRPTLSLPASDRRQRRQARSDTAPDTTDHASARRLQGRSRQAPDTDPASSRAATRSNTHRSTRCSKPSKAPIRQYMGPEYSSHRQNGNRPLPPGPGQGPRVQAGLFQTLEANGAAPRRHRTHLSVGTCLRDVQLL